MDESNPAAEVLISDWAAMAPHHKRGALLIVDAEVDLLELARAVSTDRADVIQEHVAAGRLGRPDAATAERFDAAPRETRLRFVIVQPYVFAQLCIAVPSDDEAS